MENMLLNRKRPGAVARWRAHLALAGLVALAPAASAGTRPPAQISAYHGDPAHDGNFIAPDLTWATAPHLRRDRGFDGRVPGHVYAQPLFWTPPRDSPGDAPGAATGRVIVATEDNVVVALDAVSGRIVWQTRLGPPVSATAVPCGNIDPLGITGTPVIDPRTGTIFLDAVLAGPAGPLHEVFGLRLADGAVLPGWPIDVGAAMVARGLSFVARDQNQRAALALLDGRVFVAFGGHAGDCGRYHGIVLGFATANPRLVAAWVTRGKKGGIWSPGGISVADGRLFFTTGNTDRAAGAGAAWDDGIGAFRETPALPRLTDPADFFAPRDFVALDAEDFDLGGTMPLPLDLPDGARRLVAMGKDGKAYLLDRDNLGGIGGALAVRRVARGPIITAPVAYRSGGQSLVAFRAPGAICPDGRATTAVVALAVGDRDLRPVWCAPLDGRGIPIVTMSGPDLDPIVWVVGAEGDDRLHGFRGDTGQTIYSGDESLPWMRHFVTPMVAAGRLYVAGDGQVFAFRWDGSGPASR